MFIPDILQAIESTEKHGFSFVLLMIVLCLVVFFLGRRFVRIYAEHTKKLGAIDCMFDSICDPRDPKRTVKRADILEKIGGIDRRQRAMEERMDKIIPLLEALNLEISALKTQNAQTHNDIRGMFAETKDLVRQTFETFRSFTSQLGTEMIHALRNGKH